MNRHRWLRRARRATWGAWIAVVAGLLVISAWSRLSDPVIVAGRSMEPALPLGSVAVPTPTSAEDVSVGEILTVRAGNGVLVTHRAVGIVDVPDGRYFELRGDANASADPALVPARSIVGRVDGSIPFVGFLLALMLSPTGLLAIVALLAAGLLLVWLLEDLERAVTPTPGVAGVVIPRGARHAAR